MYVYKLLATYFFININDMLIIITIVKITSINITQSVRDGSIDFQTKLMENVLPFLNTLKVFLHIS